MVRTAIQLQTLESLPEALPDTIRRVDDTPFEGIELWDPAIESPGAVAEAIAETTLEVIGAHVRLERLERESEYEDVIETYDELGCRRLIVPAFDEAAFDSPEDVASAAARLEAVARRLADDGFDCCYHNDSVEFGRLAASPRRSAYDAFVDATPEPVAFELDTGLATHGGGGPETLLARHGERIPLVHLTDSVPGSETTRQVELGAGAVDVPACVEGAREAGVEWLVYEYGMTEDTLDSLAHGATKLTRLVHGRNTIEHSSFAATD